MARKSQTEMAVLGALGVAPMTGYALRQAIHEVLGHFWSESFGQIYPTLSRLEADGLVVRSGTQRSAPYSITEAGLHRLRELLGQPVQQVPPRNGLMLRLFFGRQLGPDRCQQLVREAREQAEQQLVQFEAIRAEMATEPETGADHQYWFITIAAGEHAARATIDWADETTAALARIGATP